MNQMLGWGLVVLAVVAGWLNYGWQGLTVVGSAVVFWLLLQFNRSIKVMTHAARAPVGHVPSAVMLNAKLKPGMAMLDIVALTRSLGRQASGSPETWVWADAGGAQVSLVMHGAKLASWTLARPEQLPETEEKQGAAASP